MNAASAAFGILAVVVLTFAVSAMPALAAKGGSSAATHPGLGGRFAGDVARKPADPPEGVGDAPESISAVSSDEGSDRRLG